MANKLENIPNQKVYDLIERQEQPIGQLEGRIVQQVGPPLPREVLVQQWRDAEESKEEEALRLGQEKQANVINQLAILQGQGEKRGRLQHIEEQSRQINELAARIHKLEDQLKEEKQGQVELRLRLEHEMREKLVVSGRSQVSENQINILQRTVEALHMQLNSSSERIAILEQELNVQRGRMVRRNRINDLKMEIKEITRLELEFLSNTKSVAFTSTIISSALFGPLGMFLTFSLSGYVCIACNVNSGMQLKNQKALAENELRRIEQEEANQ